MIWARKHRIILTGTKPNQRAHFCQRRSPDHGTVNVVVVVVVVFVLGGTTLVFDFFKILKSLSNN